MHSEKYVYPMLIIVGHFSLCLQLPTQMLGRPILHKQVCARHFLTEFN